MVRKHECKKTTQNKYVSLPKHWNTQRYMVMLPIHMGEFLRKIEILSSDTTFLTVQRIPIPFEQGVYTTKSAHRCRFVPVNG